MKTIIDFNQFKNSRIICFGDFHCPHIFVKYNNELLEYKNFMNPPKKQPVLINVNLKELLNKYPNETSFFFGFTRGIYE